MPDVPPKTELQVLFETEIERKFPNYFKFKRTSMPGMPYLDDLTRHAFEGFVLATELAAKK